MDDVEDHSHVHAVGGGPRFDEVELRLGPVHEYDPTLDTLGVVALGFQHRFGDHLGRLPFKARPSPFSHRARSHRLVLALARVLFPGWRGIRPERNSSGLRTNGAVV